MQDDTITLPPLGHESSNGTDGAGTPTTTDESGPSTLPEELSSRAQAGPLPVKRGEIGYVDPRESEETESASGPSTHDTISSLPAVHPADRGPSNPPAVPSQPTPEPATDNVSTHTTHSTHSKLLKLLKPKRIPCVFGIRLTTLLLFFAHITLLGATITGWALTIQHLSKIDSSSASSSSDNSSNSSSAFGSGSSEIFVHVAFAVACLAELVFIERRIFRIRAERYVHKHGGDSGLPMHLSATRRVGDMSIGLTPWSRPPLPTYAATLAQSGVGTGDVEDSVIAIPPPPAYGNTRGSMLLLSGFMSNTHRAQRTEARQLARERGRVQSGPGEAWRDSWASRASRPVSYRSHDEEWEERCDAMRATCLEETLARLEEARTRD